MTISKPRVKHGPYCTCRACQVEHPEFWAEQQRIDEAVHRERLEREHFRGRDRDWEEHVASVAPWEEETVVDWDLALEEVNDA